MCRNPERASRHPAARAAAGCGIAMILAAAAADAQVRGRDGVDGPRGPAAKAELRAPGVTSTQPPVPPPPPPETGVGVGTGGMPFPGPIRFPGEIRPVNPTPGPLNTGILAPSGGGAPGPAAAGQASLFAAPSAAASSRVAAPGAAALAAPVGSAPAAAPAASRVTEIIPTPSQAAAAPQGGREPARTPAAQGNLWASTDPCVNVFVRAAKVDGRDVVSVDLHGDGLIKGAVPPQLAGELLARAGAPSPNGTRAACVPPALAQSLFNPVVNVAAVDPAVRMAHDGDRWVLAGASVPAARAEAPMQLASATTTRGAAKAPPKNRAQAKPRAPAPQLVAYWIYP